MSKAKHAEREKYDIESLLKYVDMNAISSEPVEYNQEKMAIFGANVNLKRYICDIKDGLKPVHRRMLYTMYMNKLFPGKEAKCAQVVGDVMKHFHPHGDEATYGAIVYQGQTWRNNVTLVHTSTNFGSAYRPDGYAHYRYTSCGLSEFAYDCFFKDWKFSSPKEDMTVDWGPNYDDSELEPLFLPAKYPLFILNWHNAIGLGRSTTTFGFNLVEAFNAVIELLHNPDADIVLYPDDPKGCTIVNKKDLRHIMDDLSTKVRLRSPYRVVINPTNGREVIEIYSAPFEVAPTTIKEAIQTLAEKGELPEISDVEGCSVYPGDKFRISIELKKGYDAEAVMEKLYKKTALETTFTSKYAFVNGLQSVDYTLRMAILEWIRYRRQTIKRMNKIKRLTILKRMHFLQPLIKVLKSGEIDEFIKIVRQSRGEDAVQKIMNKFSLTDYQAEKIVGVRISDLSIDKLHEFETEYAELVEEEAELAELTKSKKVIDKIIVEQLQEGIKKYGSERKSRVIQLSDEPKVIDTDHYLIFTNSYVKKLPYDDRGYRIGRLDNNEKVLKVMVINNTKRIAIFTSDGRCLPIDVNDIGNSSLQSVGIAYTQLGCKVNSFVDACEITDETADFIVTVTEKGLISKTNYSDFAEKEKSFALMKIGTNDKMTGVCHAYNKDELLIYTNKGNAAIFSSDDFETTSPNTKGVQSAKIDDDERVLGVTSFGKKAIELLTVTDRGYMKRFPIKYLPETKRNGKCIEINSSNGTLIKVIPLNDVYGRMYIATTDGVTEFDPRSIKAATRIGRNERVVELKASDYAFDVIK